MDGNKRRRTRRRLSLATATAGDGDGDGMAAAPPPAKRQRCHAVEELPSPRRGLLRQSVLVVVFLRRAMLLAWGGRKADDDDGGGSAAVGVSRIGGVVRDELRRCLGPIARSFSLQFSKLERKLESRLERIDQRIENLNHKVDQITPLRRSHCNHQHPMQGTNNEGANAEGVETNEDDDKNTCVRLRFLNEMKPPIYHDDELKAENSEDIRIGIFDGEQMIKSGPLSKVKLEILALEGNFPYNSMESWTTKEFNEHRACGRDERGDVLAGERTVQLINGEASLGAIKFREGSCKARKGKFILAARVCDSARTGVHVQEAVMTPVVVQDRRNKSNEKSHPPKLDDKVHRLEEIAINGIYCKRLVEKGIKTVKDFLKALNKDPDNLANILHMKKGSKAWEKMVTHARDCSLEGKPELKSYPVAQTNVVLIFDCVNSLVGAWFGGSYIASDSLSSAQQVIVDKLKGEAYQLLDQLPFDYIMEGGFPILNPMNANADYRAQGTEAVGGLDHAQIDPSFANANYQDQSTAQAGQEQFSSAAVAGWCQDSIAQPSSSHQTNHVVYPGGAQVNYSHQTNCVAPCDYPCQGASMVPGFDQVELQGRPFLGRDDLEASTSAHNNLPFPPQQQFTFSGDPGSSAQVNMQSQGNSKPSTSTTQGNLPTQQQWSQSQYHGNNWG
ncbi:hypothetical protein OsI_38699 [Oryza sativa Indica Group]|uniref:Uncharacterized protein n=1 Tax=Oryza sativa subsp. indica TaxID=39946 RepID=B8BMG4_ORYSI|nr:hypothetical protein OsI_38699 [Oryza sativa Indica Group]